MSEGIMTQSLVTLPGLDEFLCVNEDSFVVVPSTEAAVDRITATANERGEEEVGVLLGLITDIGRDGRAGEPR